MPPFHPAEALLLSSSPDTPESMPTAPSSPDLTRGLLLLGLLASLLFIGCSGDAPEASPISKGQLLVQFESLSSGSVNLGEGLEVTKVRGRWFCVAAEEEGPERWLNLDGLSSMTVKAP